MNRFKHITKIIALLISATLGRAQLCELPPNTAIFAAIQGFQSVGDIYCSMSAPLNDRILDSLLGEALAKENRSPGFIASCMPQFFPNFQNHLNGVSYSECPPADESLSGLTTAIRPLYRTTTSAGYDKWWILPYQTDESNGNMCVNFDSCNMEDLREYLKITIQTIQPYTAGTSDTVKDVFLPTSACKDSFMYNVFYRSGTYTVVDGTGFHGEKICQSDASPDQCDTTRLLDVTLGDNKPFSVALCLDECNDPAFTEEIQLGLSRKYIRDGSGYCQQGMSTNVDFSSESFEVEEYCKAELRNARQGQCECKNDPTFRFNNAEKKSCEWFSYNDNRREKACLSLPWVRKNCPILCGNCCADVEYFTFKRDNGITASCKWIRNIKRKERYCMRNKIRKNCPVACDSCVDFIKEAMTDEFLITQNIPKRLR